jgi:hypothetical protein
MEAKTPVLLLVLVETDRLRWFVASVGLDGRATPLLRSEVGDLDRYRGLAFDEQVAFLRHRFCGVLQRGCDRLWARGEKARQFVILFEAPLAEPTGGLTRAVAEHFALWMLNPPVGVFVSPNGFTAGGPSRLEKLAGELDGALDPPLAASLAGLLAVREDAKAWELVRKKVPNAGPAGGDPPGPSQPSDQ